MHSGRRSILLSAHIDLATLSASEARIKEAQKSENTRIAYASGWQAFSSWCEVVRATALPADPQVVKNFITWCLGEGYRINTVSLRLSIIGHYHRQAGHGSPVSKEVWNYLDNAKRFLREEPRSKHAITSDMLRKMLASIPDSLLGIRNRAMLLVTFAAGWRKSEVTTLRYSDIRFLPSGVEIWLRYSKTDQVGEGRLVGIQPGDHEATCPVRSLQQWIGLRGDWDGALFPRLANCGRTVSREMLHPRSHVIYGAVKKAISSIGEDQRKFGAHSLRAGMVTEAAKNGASETAIMQRTGHKSSLTLRKYIRPATAFDFNPLKGVL